MQNFKPFPKSFEDIEKIRVEELTFISRYTEINENKFSYEDLKRIQEEYNNKDRAVIAAFGECV